MQNDNSKNQLYLGMGFDAAQVFPHSNIVPDQMIHIAQQVHTTELLQSFGNCVVYNKKVN